MHIQNINKNLRKLLSTSLVHWSIAFSATTIIVKILRFLSVTYLATILTPLEFGQFGLAFAVITALGSFGCAGVVERTVEQLADYKTKGSEYILYSRQNGILLMNVIFWTLATASIFCLNFPVAETAEILNLLLAIIAGSAMAMMTQQNFVLLQENKMVRSIFLSAAVGGGISLGIALAVYLNGGLTQIMLAAAIFAWAGQVLALWGDWPKIKWLPFNDWPQQLIALSPYYLVAIIGWMGGYGFNVLVGSIFDTNEVAIFTFLFTLCAVLQIVSSSFNSVWSPRFYRLYNSGQNALLEAQAILAYKILTVVMAGVACCLIISLPLLSTILPNVDEYVDDPIKFALLCAGMILVLPVMHVNNYMYVTKSRMALLWSTFLPTVFGITFIFFMSNALGDLWLYAGYAIWMFFRSWASFMSLRRIIDVTVPWIWIVSSAIITVAAGFIT